MSKLRPISPILRMTALALVSTAAFAGGPWFRGGSRGGSVGGFRGGPRASVGLGVGIHAGGGVHLYGGTMHALPRGYVTYTYGGNPWFYQGGFWYRPWQGAYVGCYPPIGLCLPLLPLGFTSFWYNDVRYYNYEEIYYTDAPTGGYVVADPPAGRTAKPAQPRPGSADAAALDALLIIPKEGQKEDRMAADREKAQIYAMERSGYDPAESNPGDPGTPRARRAYLKAMRSYLEERGYSVK